MDYDRWIRTHLRYAPLHIGLKKVGLWVTDDETKPLAVLVHGISGDFYGLVPLAVELSRDYRIAIIELPGHGRSDELPRMTSETLRRWFEDVVQEVEKTTATARLIVAHSFGCIAVTSEKTMNSYPVVLVNPVPTPTVMYRRYARMITRSARFWAHIYNWQILVIFRSIALTKLWKKDAIGRVRWIGRRSQPSAKQVVYQARLVDATLERNHFLHIKDAVRLVVCGKSDTTARERTRDDLAKVFGATDTIFLPGGHLLPIEDPHSVARVIKGSER